MYVTGISGLWKCEVNSNNRDTGSTKFWSDVHLYVANRSEVQSESTYCKNVIPMHRLTTYKRFSIGLLQQCNAACFSVQIYMIAQELILFYITRSLVLFPLANRYKTLRILIWINILRYSWTYLIDNISFIHGKYPCCIYVKSVSTKELSELPLSAKTKNKAEIFWPSVI